MEKVNITSLDDISKIEKHHAIASGHARAINKILKENYKFNVYMNINLVDVFDMHVREYRKNMKAIHSIVEKTTNT